MIFIFCREIHDPGQLKSYQYLSKDPDKVGVTNYLKDMIHTKLENPEHTLSLIFLGMGDIDDVIRSKPYCV